MDLVFLAVAEVHRVLLPCERAHDLGIFKAIGMTSRQTIAMVVCSVVGTGLVIAAAGGMLPSAWAARASTAAALRAE
ncbi:MAG TPA: hypothetical protein VGI96_30970 [Streptosporangiaceae bacterium]